MSKFFFSTRFKLLIHSIQGIAQSCILFYLDFGHELSLKLKSKFFFFVSFAFAVFVSVIVF